MRKVKLLFSIVYWTIILALIVISASTALSVFKVPGGISLFSVQSGSMEPTIKTGVAVLIQKQSIYKESDIITFLGSNKKDTTTHRISAIKDVNGEKIFTTKGDSNRGEDRETIKENQILGKMIFFIPYLGYMVSFAKTQMGFIFLIIVPAVIIIFSEVLNIKKEILKIIEKRKIPNKTTKILTLLLLIGTTLIFSTSTKAYLSDKEKSNNNVLQAGIWGASEPSATPTTTPPLTPIPSPTPTINPGDVVINEIMWGGSDDEWIELRNMTSNTIDISSWTIENVGPGGNNINIPGSSSIGPNGLFLIAENKNSSSINVDPDHPTAAVSLLDNGEVLNLRDSSNQIIDTANATPGWLEGTNSAPRKTMERKDPPGDGTQVANWQDATTHTGMDGSGPTDEFGTPKNPNGL